MKKPRLRGISERGLSFSWLHMQTCMFHKTVIKTATSATPIPGLGTGQLLLWIGLRQAPG
jgi:hypothetical protein